MIFLQRWYFLKKALINLIFFFSGWTQSQRTKLEYDDEHDPIFNNALSYTHKNHRFPHQVHPNHYMKRNDTFHATIKSHRTHQTFDDGNLERAFSHKSRNLLSTIDGNSHVLSDDIVSNLPKLRHAGSTNIGSYRAEDENQRLNGENIHNSYNFNSQSSSSSFR